MRRRRGTSLSPGSLGVVVFVAGVLLFLALFLGSSARALWSERAMVQADFREVGGLRLGSSVRFAGSTVGTVSEIRFLHVQYECNPLTEDIGRYGDGRTDDCDATLFCTPASLCGDLENWAGREEHPRCDTSEQCREDEICVTTEFRSHAVRTEWTGPLGVCARYQTEHWRAQVLMDLPAEVIALIHQDSRATITSNSVLGDQLVDISPGRSGKLGPQRRIHARSSIFEDIDRLRRRVDNFLQGADDSILAIVGVIDELRDETLISALKDSFYDVEVIMRELAYAEGVLGALISEGSYRRDFGDTLTALTGTTHHFDEGISTANSILATLDDRTGPLLAEVSEILRAVQSVLELLEDPDNRSVLARALRSRNNAMSRELTELLVSLNGLSRSTVAITRAVEDERGTLGKLLADPVVRDSLGRLLHNLARHDLIRALAEVMLERYGLSVAQVRDSAGVRTP